MELLPQSLPVVQHVAFVSCMFPKTAVSCLCLFFLRRKLVIRLPSHVAKIFNVSKGTKVLRIGNTLKYS